jgi:hypothetical protein
MDNNTKSDYVNTETETLRITMIRNKDKIKEQQEKMKDVPHIKVFIQNADNPKDPFVMRLFGFNTIQDAAGVAILHIKIKSEDNLVMYLKTDHPNTDHWFEEFKLALLIASARCGQPVPQLTDMQKQCEEAVKVSLQVEKGQIKAEEGCHPRMEPYILE